MCICILIPENGIITEDRLREAYTANPDGCGLMWPQNGRLVVIKGMYSYLDFLVFFRKAKRPLAVHFRTASSGSISNAACHPLFVNEGLAFVQNGNFFEFSDSFKQWNDGLTDVQRFNEYFLKKLPCDFFGTQKAWPLISSYCVNRLVKMIFMSVLGDVQIINEAAGEWRDGCWYSNGGIENYIGYGYSGAYPYRQGETRHLGGLESVQMFEEKERKKWKQCRVCSGWFPKEKITKSSCPGCLEWGQLMKLVEG